jgi:hypothetical protein
MFDHDSEDLDRSRRNTRPEFAVQDINSMAWHVFSSENDFKYAMNPSSIAFRCRNRGVKLP